ncbi:MAG: GNAT family N-acetyltransferase [Micromonosporaceae bacterium]
MRRPQAGDWRPALDWRPLTTSDVPALVALYADALVVDGGQPFAGDEPLLRRWYVDEIEQSLAAFHGDPLVGACARRHAGTRDGPRSVIVGQVAPDQRGRGVGTRLLDFALGGADAAMPVRVETESLTVAADALYRSRGLRRVFAEDVMSLALAGGLPSAAVTRDVVFTEWSARAAPRFFAVYDAAFRARPGFPGWPAERWIEWISDDDDFRADWTLLASAGGVDVGFVAGATGGWIVQVGVLPAARRQAVATTLIVEVLRRMLAAGETRAVLNVNVDNPSAIGVYQRLGFDRTGRRARYETTAAPMALRGRKWRDGTADDPVAG